MGDSHPCTVSNKHRASWSYHDDTTREAAIFIFFQACRLVFVRVGHEHGAAIVFAEVIKAYQHLRLQSFWQHFSDQLHHKESPDMYNSVSSNPTDTHGAKIWLRQLCCWCSLLEKQVALILWSVITLPQVCFACSVCASLANLI